MLVVEDIKDMKEISSSAGKENRNVVLVPTMGHLHDGHASLLTRGRELGDTLVMSVFVNPAQFGPKEDYETYPRDIEMDRKIAEASGVDIMFCPNKDDIYQGGFQTAVEVQGMSKVLCGQYRPGHFAGVSTIVLKLFNIVNPDIAVFGEKDYQQLAIIRRMTVDLNMDIDIQSIPIVREDDGLAMSSRNRYLKPQERKAATHIYKALFAGGLCFDDGVREVALIIQEVMKVLGTASLIHVEYVKVCDRQTLDIIDTIREEAMLALAVRIGNTRLIDNYLLEGIQNV